MVAIQCNALESDSTAAAAWRLDRVSFASDERPVVSLEFHPRLNVVVVDEGRAGPTVERLRRALGEGEDGTHVEFTLTAGPALVAFRPVGGRHRLIDISRAEERPLTLLGELAEAEPAPEQADGRAIVAALSPLEQHALWAAADQVLALRAELAGGDRTVVALPGGEGPATPTIDLRRHQRRGLLRRWSRAATPPGDDVAAQLAAAERTWQALAGTIDADTAMPYRDRSEAAARVLVRLGALAAVSTADSAAAGAAGDADAAIDAVCALVPLRRPSGGPHIVEVPGPATGELITLLLDHLATLSDDRQIVVVTSDEQVVDWARLEHHARRAALLRLDVDA